MFSVSSQVFSVKRGHDPVGSRLTSDMNQWHFAYADLVHIVNKPVNMLNDFPIFPKDFARAKHKQCAYRQNIVILAFNGVSGENER